MTRRQYVPVCETWADHEFGGPVVVAGGRHPVRGAFRRARRQCGRCGKTVTETTWLAVPGLLPTEEHHYKTF